MPCVRSCKPASVTRAGATRLRAARLGQPRPSGRETLSDRWSSRLRRESAVGADRGRPEPPSWPPPDGPGPGVRAPEREWYPGTEWYPGEEYRPPQYGEGRYRGSAYPPAAEHSSREQDHREVMYRDEYPPPPGGPSVPQSQSAPAAPASQASSGQERDADRARLPGRHRGHRDRADRREIPGLLAAIPRERWPGSRRGAARRCGPGPGPGPGPRGAARGPSSPTWSAARRARG